MSPIASSQIDARAALPGLPARPRCLTTNISLGDAFCVLVPLLQFVKFDLIGEMCLSDFLIAIALPLAVWRHSERLRQRPVSAILSLGLLWLISQIITDLLRGSPPEDYFRGWCKIFLLLANFAVVWIVACRSLRRFVLYGAGLTVGLILQFYANPSAQAQIAPWKFALGVPVTLLAMMVISFAAKGNFLGIILPGTALTVLHAFEDVRSLAVVTFLAAIFTVCHLSSSKAQRGFRSARM